MTNCLFHTLQLLFFLYLLVRGSDRYSSAHFQLKQSQRQHPVYHYLQSQMFEIREYVIKAAVFDQEDLMRIEEWG